MDTATKMKPEIKDLWVKALRSGEYAQGRDALCSVAADGTKQYCCLGVLCDLAAKAGEPVEVKSRRLDVVYYDSIATHLPAKIMVWAGLVETDPRVAIRNIARYLSNHNDSGRTFAEIADAIEEQL